MKRSKPNPYHFSLIKKVFDFVTSLLLLVLLSPIFLVTAVLIKLTSEGPPLFIQKRIGKNNKTFTIFKFRTMKKDAEKQQLNLMYLNEAEGPVFKIHNDPRYTKFGKVLARTGLDELPQIINVIKGEMSLVGPRPLPVKEAEKLTTSQKKRHLVKPGITSDWVVKGSHSMKFEKWMQLDKEYVFKASFLGDLVILLKTLTLISKLVLRTILMLFL